METVIDLARRLVATPSYVQGSVDEAQLAAFIYEYLSQFPFLTVTRQDVAKGRYNVLATTGGDTCELLIGGHMDTVEPKQGWECDQFAGEIRDGKLFGIGALDMKGGIAAILTALGRLPAIPRGLTLLFYCDEEYDFAGMRTFLRDYASPAPRLGVIAEPSQLKIWNAQRGLIEVTISVRGRTGHAANPQEGVNAIDGLWGILRNVDQQLEQFSSDVLGKPSMNVAFFRGGLDQGITDRGDVQLGRQGNNIADYAEAVIDIRTTSPALRAAAVVDMIDAGARQFGLTINGTEVRHDLGALVTEASSLQSVEEALQSAGCAAEYLDPSGLGYSDGQMIAERFEIPVINLGPIGSGMHAPNECVDVESLETLSTVYVNLITSRCCAVTPDKEG